jgi:SanA protein
MRGWRNLEKVYRHHMRVSLILHWLTWRRLIVTVCIGLWCAAAAIWAANQWVESTSAALCHSRLEEVPELPVALVLGCSPTIEGRPNLFYVYRMEAAVRLYQSGKVRALIVSGDNGSKQYDEPTAMKADLVRRGVPAEAVYCDYAGFRTLDSVVRSERIFGQKRFLVVSQRFHNERAVFLARRHGLDAEAFDAGDVNGSSGLMTHLREHLARVQAVLDVTVLRTKPRFEGPPVRITQS